MKFVTGAVTDADVILYVTDTVEQGERSAEIVGRIRRKAAFRPSWSINKIDLSTPEALEALVDKWQAETPRGAGRPHVGQGEFQHRGAVPDHPLAAARRPGVLPQGYAYGQDAALLRLGDHPREDPQILRQGDPLLLRNRDRKLQGGADDRPHRGDDLRGPRLAEGHPDRPQGREAEEGRTDGARRHGTVPRQEGFPPVVRQGQRRLGATTNGNYAGSDTNRNNKSHGKPV